MRLDSPDPLTNFKSANHRPSAEESRMTQPFAPEISDAIANDHPILGLSSVVDSFERQVISQPDATALEVNDKTFTYQALDSRANSLAQQLNRQGIGPNHVVAICLKRTENLIIGM